MFYLFIQFSLANVCSSSWSGKPLSFLEIDTGNNRLVYTVDLWCDDSCTQVTRWAHQFQQLVLGFCVINLKCYHLLMITVVPAFIVTLSCFIKWSLSLSACLRVWHTHATCPPLPLAQRKHRLGSAYSLLVCRLCSVFNTLISSFT